MIKKIKLPIFIFLCIFYSCSQESKINEDKICGINLTQLLKNDSNRLEVNDRAKDGTITMLTDKSHDSLAFGAYYFYPNGQLKSYKFFYLSTTYSYNEEYDSIENITLIEGSPIVLHRFRQKNDSVITFTFLFSTLNKEYKNIHIRTNKGIEFDTEISSNKNFTNMSSVTFDLPVAKTFNETIIYLDCHLTNICQNKQWSLKDTATFKKAIL